MAHILQQSILARKLGSDGNQNLGPTIQIERGMAIEKCDDNPLATTIVIEFNGDKYVTDKELLVQATTRNA
jgi:hypothetical protein